MKTLLTKIVVIAAISFSGIIVQAQIPSAGGPPPPLPAGPGAPGPRAGGLQSLTTITGTIADYTANERYAYNSFTLQVNGQPVLVRFPEHLGSQLMASAKKGGTISVSGFYETGPDGVNAFHLVSANAGSSQITDIPAVPPAPPVPDTATMQQTFKGSISSLRRNPEGAIDGAILDSKVMIELPPPVSGQLQPLLSIGKKIEVAGFKVVPPPGVVMSQSITTIRPQTITLGGQTYIVR